jgi:hypothetical protein
VPIAIVNRGDLCKIIEQIRCISLFGGRHSVLGAGILNYNTANSNIYSPLRRLVGALAVAHASSRPSAAAFARYGVAAAAAFSINVVTAHD